MRDWASSGRVKIERAKEHIKNFDTSAKAAFESGLYSLSFERDAEPGYATIRVRGGPIPAYWSAIVGDAVHNLRIALDYLWRDVWTPQGTPVDRRDGFPTFLNADKFEARFRRVQKGTPQVVVKLLREIKPYKGGNDALCDLVALDDRDKHHAIVLICGRMVEAKLDASRTFVARGIAAPENPVLHLRATKDGGLYPLEDGTPVARANLTAFKGKVEVETECAFQVAFGESEIRKLESVVDTLNEFAGVVEGVVQTFSIAGLIHGAASHDAPPGASSILLP
jgi:hypothetical protein